VTDRARDFEDLGAYRLDDDDLAALLATQTECTFSWSARDGWSTAVTMRYLWRDERVWMTATRRRSRVAAVERDPRVSIVVTSAGTSLRPMLSVTMKGIARVHDRGSCPPWFADAWADHHPYVSASREERAEYLRMLDSPGRVVIEVRPVRWFTYDGAKMAAATGGAMRVPSQ
jgi:hypothetical protein